MAKRVYPDHTKERRIVGRKQKSANRGKHYYANDHSFHNNDVELPAEFEDKIICGDSEEELKRLPDNCVDLVFTSPPYNFGQDYQDDDEDSVVWVSYFDKLFRIFDECIRVLKFGGRLVVNIQPVYSDYVPSHHLVSQFMMERKMIWKCEVLWEKNHYNNKYTSWGSWKSPSNPYFKTTWEYVEIFSKGDLKKTGKTEDIDLDAESFIKWTMAKWAISPEHRMKELGHPAMFPEELARRVMVLLSYRGDVVLDPFMGSGTTAVVARANGRRFVGTEINPEYCALAERRLSGVQLTGLLPDDVAEPSLTF